MRFARLANLALLAASVAVMAQAPAALAASGGADQAAASVHLPYTDPNQAGWLTLCGTNLKPVTQGRITGKPFVWRVVSDVPAPKAYFVNGAKATMFAYQPRRGTPAGAWSGTVMAAASYYYTAAHPMAQFTPIDSPLTQMTKAYPPLWDHLIELRLYLSAPQVPVLMDHYAAADIAVTGSTWNLVAGGHSSCTAGKVKAVETSVGMPGARGKPKVPRNGSPTQTPTANSARSSSASPGSSQSPRSSTRPGSSGPARPSGSGPGATPASASHSISGAAIAGLGLSVAVVAVTIVARVLRRRQRRITG